MTQEKMNIIIVGSTTDPEVVIAALRANPTINIVGVCDAGKDASSQKIAAAFSVPIVDDYRRIFTTTQVHGMLDLSSVLSPATESDAKYRSVFENMLSGVAYHSILLDNQGRPYDYVFLEVNKAFEKLVGLKKEEVIGKRVTEVLPSIKSSMFNWIYFYGLVASTGKAMKFEQYWKDVGKWFVVSVYSPKKGFFVTIYDDVTELKKSGDNLRKAYDTLKKTQAQLIQTEKMEVVGRLASGIAHEVKNPLAIIQQGLDFLTKKISRENKSAHHVMKSMDDAVDRARDIINSLLNYSRVSDMSMVPEDMNALLKSSLLLVKSDLKRYHVEVKPDLSEDLPKVSLDKNRIQQVFINIFVNAMQAMGEGGELGIRSYFRNVRSGPEIVIVVIEDTGGGIAEDVLGKIFDPFFTTKDVGEGTGLGLSIVKNIIESHGGEIAIENRKDRKGARVTIKLKAATK